MHIIDFVAARALIWRLLEIRAAMALVAGDLFMRAVQGKGRLAVIKLRVTPVFGGMATVTRLALLPLMHIVILVAIDTLTRRVAERFARHMTLRTRGVEMPPLERKVGQQMIEAMRIELNDIGIAALMFRVADTALTLRHARLLAMKTLGRLDVSGDLVVTVQTQAALFLILEISVATLAVLVLFLMRPRQIARTQQPFKDVTGLNRKAANDEQEYPAESITHG